MYEVFSKISNFLSSPFAAASHSDIAIWAAIFLGFVGSLAPCQLSGNIAAISYFGNRHTQGRLSWAETGMYLFGKIFVFSFLGIAFWLFGREIAVDFIPMFAWARKLQGPLLLVIGLVLLGWIRFNISFGRSFIDKLHNTAAKVGEKKGAFLLGVAFSLGFCPTMFSLFFGSLMPLAVSSSYGLILPPVFATATAMPFLLLAGLTVGFGLDRVMLRRSRRAGQWIQMIAGVFFIVLGISDTMTYWTL